MSEIELYKAIEELEKEKRNILESSAYRRILAGRKFLRHIKEKDFLSVKKMLFDKMAAIKIRRKKYSHKLQPVIKNNDVMYDKCKIAIYTAVIGDYDNIQRHLISFDNVDYILFVDNKEKYKDCDSRYDVRQIPSEILEKGQINANRYLKFHPYEFLNGYDYAIYLDGNVRIISDIRSFINYCSPLTGIAMHAHRNRDCIYDEAEVCVFYRKGIPDKIKKQMARYKSEGFPKHFGMNEATIIVSDLRNDVARRLLNIWWFEFEKSECKRDQLIWPYILWKNKLSINDIGCIGNDIYNNYKLEIIKHAK